MATVFDVARTDVIDSNSNAVGYTVSTVDVIEVLDTNSPSIIETLVAASPNTVEIAVAGPQGPPGLQNVFVGPTPPANPQINWIWIDTAS